MKNSPSRSGASVRRYFVLALCASLLAYTLLASVSPPSSAQRRVAVRVPAGEATTPAAAPRKSERERERAGRRRARAQDGLQTGGPGSVKQDGETVGVPWMGDAGVEQTTTQLMRAQAEAPKGARVQRLAPEHEVEGRDERPQDPGAQPAASSPGVIGKGGVVSKGGRGIKKLGALRPQAIAAPQTLGVNFNAVTGPTETGAFPPDTMGAVGPTQFFVFVNGRLRTFNKTTGAADGVINADSDVFFAPVMTTPNAGEAVFTSDPQIRYDRLSGRWILIILDVILDASTGATTRSNRVLVAVSDAASSNAVTAGTVWTFYFFQQDTVGGIPSTGQFLDYPSLGVDANALYIGGDMYTLAGAFSNTAAFVVRKSSVLSGGPIVVTAFRNLIGTDGPLEPRGVDNYDPTSNEGYFIGVSFAAFSRLNMRRVANPGGTPTISADIPLTTPLTTTSAIAVDHLGNTGGTNGRVDGIDDRLYAAHIRNGRLWTAHSFTTLNTGVASTNVTNRRMSVRWYEINVPANTGTPTFVQSGTIFDNVNVTQATARQYWFPSVMVSGQGHAALGYSTGGTPFRLDAATNGRLSGDTLGTTGAVNIYTTSTTAYNPPGDPGPPRRWGDYSFTTLDPLDDMTMWTIQEYCSGTNVYGTRVVKLIAPPPATPTTASPLTVSAGAASTNVVITGTSVAGSGFYDPGSNLAAPALAFNHISATVTGGVVVNSVTYNSPTQVTLNISTVGATPGPQTVTITNPDGQQATGTATITVTPTVPLAGQVLISELRFRGPASATDEFVELYNNTNAAMDISGCTLQSLTAAGARSLQFTAPGALGSGTTVMPARGHYLLTGAGYTLGGAATSDGALSSDIVDGSGVGFFSGATPTAANRIDSAGFDTRDPLFYEGTPLPPSGAGTGGITAGGEYSFLRIANSGTPADSDNNAADFAFVSTTGGVFSTVQSILGAPGPENMASAIQRNATIKASLIDPLCTGTATNPAAPTACARERVSTPVANGAAGTLAIRRKFTNNTGGNVSQLRFRIVDITTLNSPGYSLGGAQADVRVLPSVDIPTASLSGGGTILIRGLTLDATPVQALGGGLNSTVSSGIINVGTPLGPGTSINLNFLLGVQQSGNFRFFINVEALP